MLWRPHPEFINKRKQKLWQRLLKGSTAHWLTGLHADEAEGICVLSKTHPFPKAASPCLCRRATEKCWFASLFCHNLLKYLQQTTTRSGKVVWQQWTWWALLLVRICTSLESTAKTAESLLGILSSLQKVGFQVTRSFLLLQAGTNSPNHPNRPKSQTHLCFSSTAKLTYFLFFWCICSHWSLWKGASHLHFL